MVVNVGAAELETEPQAVNNKAASVTLKLIFKFFIYFSFQ
jgi:hypothetical protein